MFSYPTRVASRAWPLTAALALPLTIATPARAVPAFARQTGMQCAACHVGALGPQLTEFGRNFKIGGYTFGDSGNYAPISAMAIASYLHTSADIPDGAGMGFNDNDNVKLEEASVFFAGRITEGLGGFVQVTYDGMGHHIALDNTDIRAAREFTYDGHHFVAGLSLNNNPTLQDPWNSTPAWGFPFTAPALMPAPAAGVQLDEALGGQVFGLTAYTLIDDTVYIEGGAYHSLSKSWLDSLGEDVGDKIDGLAPYWRLGLQKTFGDTYASVGTFGFYAPLLPGFDGTNGSDKYTDWGFDATMQKPFGNDLLSVNATYIYENQNLGASFLAGDASRAKQNLSVVRLNASYYIDSTYGLTAGVFDTWGSSDALRFAPDPIDGSLSGSPNSRGFVLQADWTPFGKDDANYGTLANLRLGVQYTGYTEFNGGSSNYDGFGRDASDNNSLEVFAWVAF